MQLQHHWRQRSRVTQAIRSYFDAAGFIEVDTPVAITAPAPELYIEAPTVTFATPHGPLPRFLQTSPELAMKRLLAAGLPAIYQIAAVFRDGDFGAAHRPEFRLLEWYRRDAPWTDLLTDCENVLVAAAYAADRPLRFSYQGRDVDLTPPFRRISMDEAFRTHAGFSILDCLDPAVLRQNLCERDVSCAADDGWDDMFFRIFLSRVEPALLADAKPLFLTHFPAPLAALARKDPADPRASERFELYAGGLELANGFGELTDAVEQRQRFVSEVALRAHAGRRPYPLDEAFLNALHSLPPSAGIALGLERLLMLLFDTADIDGVAFLPWRDA